MALRAATPRSLAARLGLFFALALGLSNALVWEPIDSGPVAELRRGIASAAASVLTLSGVDSVAVGERIQMPGGAVRIVNSCTGLDAAFLLASAIVVFPASWPARLGGVAAAVALLAVVNFARVLSLAYFAQSETATFERAHVHVWPTAIVVICAVGFAAWIHLATRRSG